MATSLEINNLMFQETDICFWVALFTSLQMCPPKTSKREQLHYNPFFLGCEIDYK